MSLSKLKIEQKRAVLCVREYFENERLNIENAPKSKQLTQEVPKP